MGVVTDVFSEGLAAAGVRHMFGFPGGATVELAEGGRRHDIEFVLAHSEWAAGYMAAMYGDLTGRPGVVLTTLGPGATNAVNATANALLDRSPLLVVTGRHGLAGASIAHQRLNQVSLFEPITKWSATVQAPGFRAQLHRALRIATTEKPGPVHLDMPSDAPRADALDAGDGEIAAPCVRLGVPSGIEDAAARIGRARRPLVVAGYTALRTGAGDGLRRLVEAWGIPVVTTAKAKGVLPESHPFWAGVIDMGSPRYMDAFVGSADLLVAVGFDAVEMIGHWTHRTPVVHVDVLPNTDEVYCSELDLVGDVGGALDALAELAPGPARWAEADVAAQRDGYVRTCVLGGDRLTPTQVVFTAREILDETAIVVSDVGSHKMLLGGLWRTELPRTYFVSNGLGTMGFSLPAAVAAQIVEPRRRVVSFVGDGGLAMVAGELGTAADRGLPIVVVVFNDGALDRILRKQEAQGFPAVGTTFGNPDLVKLAEAYGAAPFRATTAAEFARAFEQALASGRTALVDARIDTAEYRQQFGS